MTLTAAATQITEVSPPQRFVVAPLQHDQIAEWDDLVSKSPHGTVFHYSWWLESASQKLTILGCRDMETGKLVAGIPLPQKQRAGLVLFHSPILTPYLGPIFDLSQQANTCDRLTLMRECGEQLARCIRGFDCLYYLTGAVGPDLQGFIWAGFRAELSYTFRFEAGIKPEMAFQQIRRTHRQKLKKQDQYTVEVSDDILTLSQMSNQTFERQGIRCPFSESYLRRLWTAASKRGRAVLYIARSLTGRPVASLFVVHDDRSSYQIVSGVDMNLQGSPAGYLLTWRAICDALNAGRAFDFEGSSIRGVEQYYRRWGASAHPVWHLKKEGTLHGKIASAVFKGFNEAGKRAVSRRSALTEPVPAQDSMAGASVPSHADGGRSTPWRVRMGRSIMRWSSPTAREEQYCWRYLSSCKRILDVACGVGAFIARDPSRIVGIDLNERNVKACVARGFHVIQGNALSLPFSDNSFDGVHSAHVMFALHARETTQYLNELVRVTQPGGTITMSTLCDAGEVFEYPEVTRAYPPQAIFRMISTSETDVGADVPGVSFKAISFRRPSLVSFQSVRSPEMWRAASVLNALQYGFGLRKYWTYHGYTIVLKKQQTPPLGWPRA